MVNLIEKIIALNIAERREKQEITEKYNRLRYPWERLHNNSGRPPITRAERERRDKNKKAEKYWTGTPLDVGDSVKLFKSGKVGKRGDEAKIIRFKKLL